MIGQLNDVGAYAPAGYRLERSDYSDGRVIHRFVPEAGEGVALECEVLASQDEREELDAFRSRNSAPAVAPTPAKRARV